MGKEAATLRGPRGGVIAANSLSLERERGEHPAKRNAGRNLELEWQQEATSSDVRLINGSCDHGLQRVCRVLYHRRNSPTFFPLLFSYFLDFETHVYNGTPASSLNQNTM